MDVDDGTGVHEDDEGYDDDEVSDEGSEVEETTVKLVMGSDLDSTLL